MIKYTIISLGCPKNLGDSECFASIMESYKMQRTDTWEEANLILINSCSFILAALEELNSLLVDVINATDVTKTKIVVTGCIMNRGMRNLKKAIGKWMLGSL